MLKKSRNYIEDKTCKAWLEWLSWQHPLVRSLVIKIDNESSTSRARAISLGLHPKASDYFIALPIGSYAGLWLEVKPDGWKPNSKAKRDHADGQKAFGEKMRSVGYQFAFCIGVDECIEATRNYLQVTN